MSKRTYEFDIAAKIDAAVSAIDNLSSGAQKKLDSINFNTGISAIRDGFAIVTEVANAAFSAIEGFASKAIEEALEAEKANLELANSLRLSGDFSVQATQDFNDLADSIASVSTFTGDAVKSSVALAKQFRLTNAEAERAVRVAADLAAVQGISLEEATRKVSQTMNGFVDKSLVKVIPGLKNLSKEALVAGDAVGLIEEKVRGSAEALGNTFAGAVFRAQEAANDIFQSFGELITQNPAIIAGINEIAKGFREFNQEIGKNQDSLKKIVTDGFLVLIEAAPAAIEAIQRISKNLQFIYFNAQRAALVIAQGPTAIIQAITGTTEYLDDLINRLDEMETKFGASLNATDDFFDPIIAKTKEIVGRVREVTKAAQENQKAMQSLGASNTGPAARAEDIFGNPEDIKKKIEAAAKDPIRFTFEALVKGQTITGKEGAAIAAGVAASVVKGAAGAQKAISAGIGAAADLIIPGIGGVVSEIVDVLGQGPEKTKQMVEEFARAIPEIIENLAESLPVLIQTLVTELPPALAKAMPTVAIGFSTALIANMPQIIKGFAQGLLEAVKQAGQALIDIIKDIPGDIFGGISGSGSGGIFEGIPILGGIGDVFGFAEGGRVPDLPQFEGDKFPARLNAGEQVLSKDLSSDLEDALAGGGLGRQGPSVLNITLQVGRAQLAQVMVELDRLNYRTTV